MRLVMCRSCRFIQSVTIHPLPCPCGLTSACYVNSIDIAYKGPRPIFMGMSKWQEENLLDDTSSEVKLEIRPKDDPQIYKTTGNDHGKTYGNRRVKARLDVAQRGSTTDKTAWPERKHGKV